MNPSQDVELRVGGGDESEGERHGPANDRLAVPQKMPERPEEHLGADVLPHGDQGEAQHRHGLLHR